MRSALISCPRSLFSTSLELQHPRIEVMFRLFGPEKQQSGDHRLAPIRQSGLPSQAGSGAGALSCGLSRLMAHASTVAELAVPTSLSALTSLTVSDP